jgi:hypothetical protein
MVADEADQADGAAHQAFNSSSTIGEQEAVNAHPPDPLNPLRSG